MITLHNRYLTVEIAEKGAELQSLRTAAGEERLWQGNPAFWARRAPVLFPVCGRLLNLQYTYEGITYPMGCHGFVREAVFSVETQTDTAVTLLYTDNEETRAVYPFAFEFRVTFALEGNTLAVTYAVHNPADTPLYMSFGGHEGYACDGGLEQYELVIPEPCTLDSYVVKTAVSRDTKPVFQNSAVLPLRGDLFTEDALVLEHPPFNTIALRRRDSGETLVTVGLNDAEYVLIWSVPDGPYVCVEPLWGVGGFEDDSASLTEKIGIRKVNGGDTYSRTHTITT